MKLKEDALNSAFSHATPAAARAVRHTRPWLRAALLLLLSVGIARAASAPAVPFELGVYITNWLLFGTFPSMMHENASGTGRVFQTGIATDYLMELGSETQAVYTTDTRLSNWPEAAATSIISSSVDVDLDTLFGMPNRVVCYALAQLDVVEPVQAYLRVGSDDGIRVWLDGNCLIDEDVERGYTPDDNWCQVALSAGRHRLLVKISDVFGAWRFSLRFVDRSTHRLLLAQAVNDELDVRLISSTSAWQRISAAFGIMPALTDFTYTVVGRWLDDAGAVTQTFGIAPGASVQMPEALAFTPKCRLEAAALGIPGKEPHVALNVYNSPLQVVLTNYRLRASRILTQLRATNATERLAAKHAGLLQFYLDLADKTTANTNDPANTATQKLFTHLDSIFACLDKCRDAYAPQQRNFLAAYISPDDGSSQPFMVSVPSFYNPQLPTPLVVFLHDTDEDFSTLLQRTAKDPPYLAVSVLGRGRSGGYVGLAARDPLHVIAWMTNFYAVDLDRICVVGTGMGGYGAWHLATRWPHLFAAAIPISGVSAELPLETLRNIAVWIIHGEKDFIVPVEYSRAAMQVLQRRAFPAVYTELRDVANRVQSSVESLRIPDMLVNQRRDAEPPEVTVISAGREDAQAYWLHVLNRINPRQAAQARARFTGPNDLIVYLDNVAAAEITLPHRHVDSTSLLSVLANGHEYEMPAPLPRAFRLEWRSNTYAVTWTARNGDAIRPYRSGSWQTFFEGESVLVVYGTGGTAACASNMLACAQTIARWSFVGRVAPYGGFRIKSDLDVTRDDVLSNNVILLGGVLENRQTASLALALKTRLSTDAVAINEDSYSLRGGGLWLCQYNPEAPQRLVWIWASSEPAFFDPAATWLQDWFYPVDDPPDMLIVRVASGRYRHARHFTTGWQLDPNEYASPSLRTVRAQPEFVARTLAQTLTTTTSADFAWLPDSLWELSAQMRGLRVADVAALLVKSRTVLVCDMLGGDLLRLREPMVAAPDVGAGRLVPTPLNISSNSLYHIAVTPRALRSFADAAKGAIRAATYRDIPLREEFSLQMQRALQTLSREEPTP